MRIAVRLFFVLVLAVMLYGTVVATMDRGLWDAVEDLWRDPWFRVTIYDTYFAFLTIWLWVAYKESTWPRRLLWLALICCLGNFAIAVYMLIQLGRLGPDRPFAEMLARNPPGGP